MTRLSVRLTMVLVCLAAAAAAAFLIYSAERDLRAGDLRVDQFNATARRAIAAAADLRAAQQAYVAAGQGHDFWFTRVSALVTEFDDVLSILRSHASTPEAVRAVDDASGAVQDFLQVDKRARDLVRDGQTTAASDVIFGDGFDLTQRAGAAADRALVAELTGRDAVVADARRQEAIAIAGASGIALAVLLLLLPGGRGSVPESARQDASPSAGREQKTADSVARVEVSEAVPAARPAPAPPPPEVDLAAMAALCADLARVADTPSLSSLLDRAAAILGATGIVIWIADPDGRELSPILIHGYPRNLANRLGTIDRNAENVTAAAYRTGLLQTLASDAVSNGAVAAPLVAAGGCVGVMAAEMKDRGEQRSALLAAATIVASQVSTLVGPPSARARNEATG